MTLNELHELARSGDFKAAYTAAGLVEGPLEEMLEAQCIGAWSLSRLGRQEEARAAALSALDEASRVLGATHRVTLEAMNDSARFAARCGDLATAVEIGTNVHRIRSEVLGAENPKTLTSLANLLRYKAAAGQTVDDAAVRMLADGWTAADPQVHDPAHLDAWVLAAELTQDRESAVRCLARFEQVLGKEHPNTARAREQLAALLQSTQ